MAAESYRNRFSSEQSWEVRWLCWWMVQQPVEVMLFGCMNTAHRLGNVLLNGARRNLAKLRS